MSMEESLDCWSQSRTQSSSYPTVPGRVLKPNVTRTTGNNDHNYAFFSAIYNARNASDIPKYFWLTRCFNCTNIYYTSIYYSYKLRRHSGFAANA